MKPIIKVTFNIDDRGVTHPSKSIEVQGSPEFQVRNYLTKWKTSMDLSNKFKFNIVSTEIVGYGTI